MAPVFAAGVPVKVPVPFPLLVNVTPLGSAPLSLNIGVGTPVAVTVKVPAVPTVNVVLLALVIVGAWFSVKVAVASNSPFPVSLALHVLVPVHPPVPLQPVNVDPVLAVAVRMTSLKFPGYVTEQVVGQLILPSLLVTLPLPVPARVTLSTGWLASVNMFWAWNPEVWPVAVK